MKKTSAERRLRDQIWTLEALLNRIDRIPRDGRPGEQRRLLAAQSEALGVAIRLMQDQYAATSHKASYADD